MTSHPTDSRRAEDEIHEPVPDLSGAGSRCKVQDEGSFVGVESTQERVVLVRVGLDRLCLSTPGEEKRRG